MIRLIDAAPLDYGDVLALNAAAIPNVNLISEETLAQLHRQAFSFRVVRSEAGLVGFVLALAETASYESPNFRWFKERYERFVYVDRIVVDAARQSAGVGRALYADLEGRARERAPLLACEVNLRPPNDRSMRFHEGFGFREVGQQETEGGTKRVRLMVKALRSADP